MWVSLVVVLPLFWKGTTGQSSSYTIEVNSSVSVQEGLCVTIPCKFTANGGNTFSNSLGYWKRSDFIVATNDNTSDVKTNFHLTGNPDAGSCTLTLSNAAKDDAGKYYFRFEDSKVKYSYRPSTTIRVTGLTEELVISDVGTLIAGVSKTLTCAPPGNCSATSLRFQWKKSNDPDIWKNSSTITFTPSIEDDQKNITCQMTNAQGTTTQKTILLHVNNPLNITITWNIPGKKQNKPDPIRVDEGSSMTLTCLVDSILTLDVTWTDEKNNVLQNGTGKKLELKLENIRMTQAGIYTCTAKNEYEKKSANINITIQYSVSIASKEETNVCITRTMDSAIIIGMVIGNIAVLVLINVGSYFFLKRRMEKRQLGKRISDPGKQATESTYQELNKQDNDVYYNFKAQ